MQINPYKLYTPGELAEILSSHRQSIYQQRVKVPESFQISEGERGKRWLGLSIINFLHQLAGFPQISPLELLTGGRADTSHAPIEQAPEKVRHQSTGRAIRLPKRKKKDPSGAAA